MGSIFNAQQIVNGLQLGSIYALIALGYTMVYGIVRLINFAHGDFYMIGAYAAYGAFYLLNSVISVKGGAFAFLILIVAMAAGGAIAMLANRLAYRPLRYKPKLSALITAIGVSFLLEYGFQLQPWGFMPVPFPPGPSPRCPASGRSPGAVTRPAMRCPDGASWRLFRRRGSGSVAGTRRCSGRCPTESAASC